jgi:hypothetical protein
MQFTVQNLFIGLLLVGIGTLTLVYNYQIVGYTGRQDWIEYRLGGGTTYLVFKLFSILVVAFGVLLATGLGGSAASWLLSPLTHLLSPASN